MNWLILIACVTATLFVAGEARTCKSAEDCRDGECCALLSGITGLSVCRKMATRKGRPCAGPDKEITKDGNKLYLGLVCPCSGDLVCQQYKKTKFWKCQEPEAQTTTTVPTEATKTDKRETEATTTEDNPGDEGTGDEGTGDEGTGDEGTGNKNDENPSDIGEGPGGEPPRDDDCEDWELPC